MDALRAPPANPDGKLMDWEPSCEASKCWNELASEKLNEIDRFHQFFSRTKDEHETLYGTEDHKINPNEALI